MEALNLPNFEVCYLTKNDCYNDGRMIYVKGIMVHSTAANNPRVNRYVPIGKNYSSMNWNKPGLKKCVHGFLGYMPNGEVGFAQTLPWNKRGWHAGGAANNTHIGFEICEDDLTSKEYFGKIYSYAVQLCGELCKKFSLYPLKDGVIICHQEGYRRGIASNHADVLHWFPKMGKSMDDFRNDVYFYMNNKGDDNMNDEKFAEYMSKWLGSHSFVLSEIHKELTDKYWNDKARLPMSSWAVAEEIPEFARMAGISDGSAPLSYATREQVLAMLKRTMESYGIKWKELESK